MLFSDDYSDETLRDATPYVTNPLMNANAAYLIHNACICNLNSDFLEGFLKQLIRLGKPFILFCTVPTVIIFMEILQPYSWIKESLNDSSNLNVPQIVILLFFGVTIFNLCTWFSYQKAIKDFERIDL